MSDLSTRYIFNFSDEDFHGKFDGQPFFLKSKQGRYIPAGAARILADQLIDREIMKDSSKHSRVKDESYRQTQYHPQVFTKHDIEYQDELEKASKVTDLGLTNSFPSTVSTSEIEHKEEIPVVDEAPAPEIIQTEMPATPRRKPGRPPKINPEVI